jgi:hypothetical protein
MVVKVDCLVGYLFAKFVSDPGRISSEIDHAPYDCTVILDRVENPIRKNPAQQSVVVPVNNAVHASCGAKPIDIGPKATDKIVPESALLSIVKLKAVVEIPERFIGDPDPHPPIVAFTESQS